MEAADVLSFWFAQKCERWFDRDDAFDGEIRLRFLALYEQACRGDLEYWKQSPSGCLALVILFDQFPRNMFRGAAEAFSSDERARASARLIVEKGWDEAMTPDERTFAYLPFQHSEAMEDQELSIRLFEGREDFEWARKHWEVIRRFGRFPQRNAALGRANTVEEAEFLEQPGSLF